MIITDAIKELEERLVLLCGRERGTMKWKDEEKARREGMSYALRIAKEQGIEELEKDLKLRKVADLPIPVSKKALEECINNIKNNTVDAFVILMIATLHDEFGFGEKRIQRAIDRFNFKAECLAEDYCSWNDYIQAIKDELGLICDIRKNE